MLINIDMSTVQPLSPASTVETGFYLIELQSEEEVQNAAKTGSYNELVFKHLSPKVHAIFKDRLNFNNPNEFARKKAASTLRSYLEAMEALHLFTNDTSAIIGQTLVVEIVKGEREDTRNGDKIPTNDVVQYLTKANGLKYCDKETQAKYGNIAPSQPQQPVPAQPAPAQPAPAFAPQQPATPAQPAPVQPAPAQSAPAFAPATPQQPVQPAPAFAPQQPVPAQPVPQQPAFNQPEAQQPQQPVPAQPELAPQQPATPAQPAPATPAQPAPAQPATPANPNNQWAQ